MDFNLYCQLWGEIMYTLSSDNDASPYQTVITGPEDEIARQRQALAAAKGNEVLLKTEIGQAADLAAQADEAVRQLRRQQSDAGEQLARARKEEAALHLDRQEQAARLQAKHQAQYEEALLRVKNTAAALAAAEREAEEINHAAEDALAVYAQARERAAAIGCEQQERHQLLRTEHEESGRRLEEALAHAASRSAAANSATEAAQVALDAARKSLADQQQALAAAEVEIQARRQVLDKLYQLKEQGTAALRQRNHTDPAGSEALPETAGASMPVLARTTGLSGEEDSAGQHQPYATDGQEAAVLPPSAAEQELLAKIQAACRLDEQAAQAIAAESEPRERAARLQLEYQDISSAAQVAKELAADATASRQNADHDMLAAFSEMERALLTAVAEAEQQTRDKKKELDEAEQASMEASQTAAQLLAAREAAVVELEQTFSARISEAEAQLNIAQDKRERFYTAQAQKQEASDAAIEALNRKQDIAARRAAELEQLRAESGGVLSGQESTLNNIVRDDAQLLDQTRKQALDAESYYEACLINSMRAAEQIRRHKQQALSAEAEAAAVRQQLQAEAERQAREAEQARQQMADRVALLEQAVTDLENPLRLAGLEAALAHKQHSRLLAQLELNSMRLRNHRDEVQRLEAEQREQSAAELARIAAAAKKMAEEMEAARIAAEAEAARLAAIEQARLEAAERDVIRRMAEEVLEREDDLMLISPETLRQRLQRFKTAARAEAAEEGFRWIPAEQERAIREQAVALTEQAEEDYRLFEEAQAALQAIHSRLTEKRRARHAAGQPYAAAIYAVEHAVNEAAAFRAADAEISRIVNYSAERALLHITGNIRETYTAIEAGLDRLQQDLAEAETRVRGLDAEVAALSASHEEALAMLRELVSVWIYNQRRAIKLQAQVEAINREAADRERLRQEARNRFLAARDAAETACFGLLRVGSAAKARPASRKRRAAAK